VHDALAELQALKGSDAGVYYTLESDRPTAKRGNFEVNHTATSNSVGCVSSIIANVAKAVCC
jgi:hypothetical protein